MKFILFAILFHVFASVFLKLGSMNLTSFSFLSVVTNYFYLSSLLFLFFQAICWQLALKVYDLSYAYLFTSLYYPFILMASYLIFEETITQGNLLGAFLIILGLILNKK